MFPLRKRNILLHILKKENLLQKYYTFLKILKLNLLHENVL